jgi:hypothetical protein
MVKGLIPFTIDTKKMSIYLSFCIKKTIIDPIPKSTHFLDFTYRLRVFHLIFFFVDKIMAEFLKPSKRISKDKSTTDDESQRTPPNVTWKHSWPSDEAKFALTQSNFQALPTEVIIQIFKFLSVHDLGNVSLVCRLFKMIADQDEIWKLKSNSKFNHFLFNFFYIELI